MGRFWFWMKNTKVFQAIWADLVEKWIYPWTEPKSDSGRNEPKKLQAAALGRLSTSCVTFGVLGAIGPSLSVFLHIPTNTVPPPEIPWLGLFFWIFMGIWLHIIAELLILDMRVKNDLQ